jgi:hypothetical protein
MSRYVVQIETLQIETLDREGHRMVFHRMSKRAGLSGDAD